MCRSVLPGARTCSSFEEGIPRPCGWGGLVWGVKGPLGWGLKTGGGGGGNTVHTARVFLHRYSPTTHSPHSPTGRWPHGPTGWHSPAIPRKWDRLGSVRFGQASARAQRWAARARATRARVSAPCPNSGRRLCPRGTTRRDLAHESAIHNCATSKRKKHGLRPELT